MTNWKCISVGIQIYTKKWQMDAQLEMLHISKNQQKPMEENVVHRVVMNLFRKKSSASFVIKKPGNPFCIFSHRLLWVLLERLKVKHSTKNQATSSRIKLFLGIRRIFSLSTSRHDLSYISEFWFMQHILFLVSGIIPQKKYFLFVYKKIVFFHRNDKRLFW